MEWREGSVESNELVGKKFRWLKIRPDKEFEYQVGQYILLKVGEQKVNNYSICALPGAEYLELVVDMEPGGEGARYISDLKVGARVRFAGPAGRFVWRDDGTEESVFVATGSGISGVLPMVMKALENEGKKVTLFWGLRFRENIFMEEELEWLTERYPNFRANIVLSEPDEEWEGMSGHVEEYVAELVAGGGESLGVYLCGSGEMIEEMRKLLAEVEVGEDRIYWEKYYGEGEEVG